MLLTNSFYCLCMTSLHLLRAKLSVRIVNELLYTSRQFTKRYRSGEVGLGNHVLVFFKIKTDSKFFSQLNASGTSCM